MRDDAVLGRALPLDRGLGPKNFQEEQLNSRRFSVFREEISNSSRFPVFQEVVGHPVYYNRLAKSFWHNWILHHCLYENEYYIHAM